MATKKKQSPADYTQTAGGMRALADPARLRILSLLAAGEMTVSEIVDGLDSLAQPTVSHHLRVLNTAGIIRREKTGVYVRYAIDTEGLTACLGSVRELSAVGA